MSPERAAQEAERNRRAAEFVRRECEIMEGMGYVLIGLAEWASPELLATKRKYGGLADD